MVKYMSWGEIFSYFNYYNLEISGKKNTGIKENKQNKRENEWEDAGITR
jgi:hypothetical protein